MNRNMIAAAAIAVLGIGGGLTAAVANEKYGDDEKCNVLAAEWQSIDDLHAKLKSDGWTNIELEKDDGCYEVEATDEQGRRIEAYFDPKTFELKKLELED